MRQDNEAMSACEDSVFLPHVQVSICVDSVLFGA